MGKLHKLFVWFRDSQAPSRARASHAIRNVHAQAVAASHDIELRAPHYYAFYYPEGREPGSGWKHPKMYVGPFTTKVATEEGIKESWPAKAGEPRKRFQIKLLTSAQFKKIWGHLVEGY